MFSCFEGLGEWTCLVISWLSFWLKETILLCGFCGSEIWDMLGDNVVDISQGSWNSWVQISPVFGQVVYRLAHVESPHGLLWASLKPGSSGLPGNLYGDLGSSVRFPANKVDVVCPF